VKISRGKKEAHGGYSDEERSNSEEDNYYDNLDAIMDRY
jgi:hypothetical protein